MISNLLVNGHYLQYYKVDSWYVHTCTKLHRHRYRSLILISRMKRFNLRIIVTTAFTVCTRPSGHRCKKFSAIHSFIQSACKETWPQLSHCQDLVFWRRKIRTIRTCLAEGVVVEDDVFGPTYLKIKTEHSLTSIHPLLAKQGFKYCTKILSYPD